MGFSNIRLLIPYCSSTFVMDESVCFMAIYEYNRLLNESVLSWTCSANETCC